MGKLRILVADDDPECRRTLFRFFNSAGHECLTAESGAKTVRMAFLRNPDAIVLDLRLGDMSGFQVMQFLSRGSQTASIPILVVTAERAAQDLLGDAAACFNAKGYLRKPFDYAELMGAVSSAVRAVRNATTGDPLVIQRGVLRIDLRRREVALNGMPLRLGPKRFETLRALAQSKDGLSVVMLRALVWGDESEPLNTVVQTITRLRQDLMRAAGRDLIIAVPGGYKLE